LIHKAGQEDDLDNYRGITINSNIGKLFARIIGKRMEEDVELRGLLGQMQHGFRKGWRATDAVFTLLQVIEMAKKSHRTKDRHLCMAFLDLRKAYNSVNRKKLWQVMQQLGYGGKLLRIIQGMYKDLETTVSLGSITTEKIPVNKGLKQGCVLSPLLFSLYISELSKELEASGLGVRVGGIIIPGLFFADDMVLLAQSEEDLQKLLHIAAKFGDKRDLTFNGKKK
jgi:hypothetical protein